MKNLILLTLLLYGCAPRSIRILDDILRGEARVVENVLEDVSGIPHQQ
jgi:hypothetical protein